jgi:hypothetical protein
VRDAKVISLAHSQQHCSGFFANESNDVSDDNLQSQRAAALDIMVISSFNLQS